MGRWLGERKRERTTLLIDPTITVVHQITEETSFQLSNYCPLFQPKGGCTRIFIFYTNSTTRLFYTFTSPNTLMWSLKSHILINILDPYVCVLVCNLFYCFKKKESRKIGSFQLGILIWHATLRFIWTNGTFWLRNSLHGFSW